MKNIVILQNVPVCNLNGHGTFTVCVTLDIILNSMHFSEAGNNVMIIKHACAFKTLLLDQYYFYYNLLDSYIFRLMDAVQ